MKTLKLTIPLIAITLCFTTCKRYPEGGWSNVAIKHLFGGHQKGSSKTWHLKKYEVNGLDSTIYISPGNGFTSFENDEITFRKGPGSDDVAESKVYKYGISFTEGLNNPKIKKIIRFIGGSKNPNYLIQCFNMHCERSAFNPSIEKPYVIWEIYKLTANEFEIRALNNNNNYKIVLNN